MNKIKHIHINHVLWLVYLALLSTLLPHTAWAFGQFEPPAWEWLGWITAISFEGAIAALTWRLKGLIETTPNYRAGRIAWRKLSYRYLNLYGLGLLISTGVSSAANWAHAVQFTKTFAVFSQYSVDPLLYSVGFGAILPLCSLLFVRILADVQDSEDAPNEELITVKAELREAKAAMWSLADNLRLTEERARATEDLAKALLATDKRERILAIHRRWPALANAGVAILAEASPAYVSEVLSGQSLRLA